MVDEIALDWNAAVVLLVYDAGTTAEGVVVAASAGLVRVAVKGADDLQEFRLLGNVWVSEDCEPVTIHAPFGIFPINTMAAVSFAPGTFGAPGRVAGRAAPSAYVN